MGGVAERLIAPVLKTGRPKGLVSSNLTPSASALGRKIYYMSSSPKALSENLILYTSSFFENTSKVIVPSTAKAKGKIVVSLGSPRPEACLVSRDLLDPAGNFAVNAPASEVGYPLDPATQINATDNQIIRLEDGSLLAAKNGYTWSDVSPQPEWFDTGNFQYGQNLFSGRARNAVYLFRSTDAGQSWVLWSMIDAAVAADGKYGWPQPNKGPTGFGIGGFDRCQLYQDPWSGDIYVSGHGDGGPYTLKSKTTNNHAGVIFRSQDNGKTWDTFHQFDDPGKRRWEFAMTSTLNHRLILLSVESLTTILTETWTTCGWPIRRSTRAGCRPMWLRQWRSAALPSRR